MENNDNVAPSADYLSVVVAFGKQLSRQVHPHEQLNAYGEVLGLICPWLERVYIVFFNENEEQASRIFLYDRNGQGVTLLEWQALTPAEYALFEDFLRSRRHDRDSRDLPSQERNPPVPDDIPLENGVLREIPKSDEIAVREMAEGDGTASLHLLTSFQLTSSSGPEGWVLFTGFEREKGFWKEEDRNAVSVCSDMLSASLDRSRLFEKVFLAKKEWERTVDAIRDVVMIIGPDLLVRRGNQQLAELANVPLEGMQGRKCYSLLTASARPGQTGAGPESNGSCQGCPALITFQTGEEATAEIYRADHEAVFQVWSYPLLDPSGHLDSVAVYEKDMTEYKRMQQQLVQTEKMAVIGQLASAVAHELNNPLSGVLSFCQILLKEMDSSSPYIEDLKNIEFAALRCKKIVVDLLAFARKPGKGSHEPINLQEVIGQAIGLMRAKLEAKGIKVVLEVPQNLPSLPVHPDPLYQILVNLISNAHDAMDVDGVLTFKAWQADDKDDNCLVLSIQDTGAGIPAQHMEKIFEPFFTTKGPGEGTGLGLGICQRMMESFNGRIEVFSKENQGTTFLLWLPLFP